MSVQQGDSLHSTQSLLDAFRVHYNHYESMVHEAMSNPTDSNVLARLGDDLDQFMTLVAEVSHKNHPVL
jgi:hypothetical protein